MLGSDEFFISLDNYKIILPADFENHLSTDDNRIYQINKNLLKDIDLEKTANHTEFLQSFAKDFELHIVLSGWLEQYILERNPVFSPHLEFLYSFNRDIRISELGEQYDIDSEEFFRAYKEHAGNTFTAN